MTTAKQKGITLMIDPTPVVVAGPAQDVWADLVLGIVRNRGEAAPALDMDDKAASDRMVPVPTLAVRHAQ
ncbi:hypothetical protein ACF06W_11395 [Streptomyces albus]|uniref:hypothetical protein n=1 Tax=Streptomyces albus TaxID=1888 RepID=UPI0036F5673F